MKYLKTFAVLAMSFVIAACSSESESGSSEDLFPSPSPDASFQVIGSVGDGPIVDARITVTDAEGNILTTTVSDAQARYSVLVPDDAVLPVTVSVTGGTDLVTNREADFEMLSVLHETGPQTVNVSPLTTLAVRAAQCTDQLNANRIAQIWSVIHSDLNIGLDRSAFGDPIADDITAGNIETAVLANEALGELVRRTGAAMLSAGANISLDEIVNALACDVADGSVDGRLAIPGRASDERVLAVAAAARSALVLEVIAGELWVDGVDATYAMNNAIRTIMPGMTSPDVYSVPLNDASIDLAVSNLAVLLGVFDDPELGNLMQVLNDATPANVRQRVAQAMDAATHETLLGFAQRVSLSGTNLVEEINDRGASQDSAMAPVISFSASPQVVDAGANTVLSWASSGADQCTASGDWQGSVALQGLYQSGALTTSAEYELVCTGLGGISSSMVAVAVNGDPTPPTEPEPQPEPQPQPQPTPAPTVSLSTSAGQVEAGDSVTLSWTSTDATACSAGNGWSGSRSASGSQTIGPLSVDTTFSLTCSGQGGSASSSVSVIVNEVVPPAPLPTVSLSVSQREINVGDSVTLSWSSTDADACTASGGWSGGRASSGSMTVGPLQAGRTFSLTCSGDGGSAVQMVSVDVIGSLAVSWSAPTENVDGTPADDLAAYRIYYGSGSRSYDDFVEVSSGSTSHSVALPVGSYYVAVTAVNALGEESGYSNEGRFSAQ